MTNQPAPDEPDRDNPPTGATPVPAEEQPTSPAPTGAADVDDQVAGAAPAPGEAPTPPAAAGPPTGDTPVVAGPAGDGPTVTGPVDDDTLTLAGPVDDAPTPARPVDDGTLTLAGSADSAGPVDDALTAAGSAGAGMPPPPLADDVPPATGPGPSGFPPPGSPPPGFPPPGFPPPGFPPPPPGTAGWAATRFGLVRPAQGRMMAGVCAAIGRSTNTDPVLWRVLFAVLTLTGGIGLLAYLLGWLFIPSEGDTGSPVEALLGRGRSGTSPILVIIAGIVAAITLGSLAYHGLRPAVVVLVVIIGAIILVSRNSSRPTGGSPPGDRAQPGPYPGGTAPSDAPRWRPGPAGWTGPVPGAPAGDTVPMPVPDVPGTAGYRAPFAPHGPYASASRYPYPGLAPTPPPPPPAPPRHPKRRSRLGRVTLSVMLLVLGVLAIVDTVGASVPFTSYVVAALTTLGVGLLAGAWFGRARGLVPLGLVLVLALAIGGVFDTRSLRHAGRDNGDITWAPSTVAVVSDSYRHNFGDSTLDLSGVDFTGTSKTISVQITAGDLTILLPPKVDTAVHAHVHVGDGRVFGDHWGGIGSPQRDVSDDGADGPGGGTLVLNVRLNAGDLEVHR